MGLCGSHRVESRTLITLRRKQMGRPIRKQFFGNTNNPYQGGDTGTGGESVASYGTIVAGSGWTSAPTVSVSAPTAPGGVTATIAAHYKALSATVTTIGTGDTDADYLVGNTLTVSGGTSTTATVFTVASVKVRTAVTAAGGTTIWTTGDTVTFSAAGWATPAVLTVTAAAGAITALTVTNAGSWTTSGSVPSDPVAPSSATVADGGGYQNDATFNLGFGINAITLTTAGDYTVFPSNPAATTTNSVNGTGATLTVTWGLLSVAVVTGGSGYYSAADAALTFSGATGASATAVLTNVNQNAIIVSAYLPAINGGLSAKDGDIMKQASSTRYLVKTADGVGQCKLVAAAPAAGEMTMLATDSAGGTYYVTKLTAHRARIVKGNRTGTQFTTGADGVTVGWSFDAAVAGVSVIIANA